MSLWLWLTFCRRSPRLEDNAYMTTTPPPTVTDSLRRTCRRQGGDKPACGQLTTGFGQPYGVRWTPPGCPLAPSHDDGGVLQLRINQPQPKERDDLRQLQSPSRHWRTSTAQTGGP